jgi:hypothetical protein
MATKVTVNGQVVGEVYKSDLGWGYFMYESDLGCDGVDSKKEAIEYCSLDATRWAQEQVEKYKKYILKDYQTALKILGET